MPDYSLNWAARSSAMQGWQRCQWCSSPTWRWPNRSRGSFGLKSAIEHAKQSAEKPLHEAELLLLQMQLHLVGWSTTSDGHCIELTGLKQPDPLRLLFPLYIRLLFYHLILGLIFWPRLYYPFVSQNHREFYKFHFLRWILVCAYTIQ